MRNRILLSGAVLALGFLIVPVTTVHAGPDPDAVRATIRKAYDALKAAQEPDGSFAPKVAGPGVTALVMVSLQRAGYGPEDPVVAKGMKSLEESVKPNGGIYGRGLANYTTSLSLVAFSLANRDGKYDSIIANAAKFLKQLQTTDDPEDPIYGGVGYDQRGGGDLSNTAYFLEALNAAGVAKDDPAMQRALVFLSRCQNRASEENKLPFAAKATTEDRGGFTYDPKGAEKDKNPRKTAEGGLRSEGAMTYAGLKSFLYAGVGKDDARVKAALDWVKKHYTVEENPGMGQAGLFYYYSTMGKALAVLGAERFTDADGKEHDWKADLFTALKKRQREDGSWVNTNRAYLESLPEIATAFGVLALSYTLPEAK